MDNSNYFKRLFRTGNQLYVCFVYKGKNYLIKNKSNKYLSGKFVASVYSGLVINYMSVLFIRERILLNS